nr:retrovirus-related Pol polyprotein from transposon TNT 1-94 [Tanacetum cinerariifolium]
MDHELGTYGLAIDYCIIKEGMSILKGRKSVPGISSGGRENGKKEAVATACFTQNRSIIRLRHGKTPYELMHGKQPDLSFFHVFGALCYPTNDSENVGKLQPKADIGIFIGYASTKKAFRIYNRRTRRIVETIHVDFDGLIAMASEQSSSGPALNDMTPGTISSGLVQNSSSFTSYVPPSKNDWDLLFQPLFDELLNPPPSVDNQDAEVIAPIAEIFNVKLDEYGGVLKIKARTDLQDLTFRQISSGLVLNQAASTLAKPPTKNDWDLLFQPMFDEYFKPLSVVSTPIFAATLPLPDTTRASSSFSISIDKDDPSSSTSPNIKTTNSSINSTNFEPNEETTEFHSDTLTNPFAPLETSSAESSSRISSRPDLVFVVCICAQYQAKPTRKHLTVVKQVFRYLKETINVGMWYPKDIDFHLTAFADADHVGCQDSRHSTSRNSKSVIASSCNTVQHSKTKHIDVRYHFNKEQVKNKVVELYFVETNFQVVDISTKALARERFEFLINRLGMQSITPKDLKQFNMSRTNSQAEVDSEEQLVPRTNRLVIKKNNQRVASDSHITDTMLRFVVEILRHHKLYKLVSLTATVPIIYLHQFWTTINYNKNSHTFTFDIDNHTFTLTPGLLKIVFQMPTPDPNNTYIKPPSVIQIIKFIKTLGYDERPEVKMTSVSKMVAIRLHQPWRAILSVLNRSLTVKDLSWDTIRLPILQILWGNYKFGMEIPDSMISDAIKKSVGYNYYMAKKKESTKDKIVDEPKEQHKGSKASRLESLRQKKQPTTGEGSSAAHNKYYDSSNNDSKATLHSSSSDTTEESANETDDADKYDMDFYDDNAHGDDDAAGYRVPRLNTSVLKVMKTNQINLFTLLSTSTDYLSYMDLKLKLLNRIHTNKSNETHTTHQQLYDTLYESITPDQDTLDTQVAQSSFHKRSHDNQDPPNNCKGENKKKRQKDVVKPSSRSSRKNSSHVVIVKDDTSAMQPLDQADILIQKHSKPVWSPKKSRLAKRRTTWFDLFLKSDIDKDENHILRPSSVAIAKKFK